MSEVANVLPGDLPWDLLGGVVRDIGQVGVTMGMGKKSLISVHLYMYIYERTISDVDTGLRGEFPFGRYIFWGPARTSIWA